MEFGYTQEQLAVRELVRDFARKEVEPLAEESDKNEAFPYEAWRKLAGMGIVNVNLPEEAGGSGADMLSMCLATEELSYYDSSYGPTLTAQQSCTLHILRYAREPMRSKWIEEYVRPIARGEKFGATALTEPNSSSSDAAAMRTTAIRDGESWVINGTKMFSTAAGLDGAAFVIVWAIVDQETRERQMILVPHGTPGFTVGGKLHKLGMRAADTRELFFDNCRVPIENVLDGGDANVADPVKTGTQWHSRLFLASNAVGLQRYCLDRSIEFAKSRKSWGVPLADRQLIQGWIAEMAADIKISTLLRNQAAVLYDRGELTTTDSAILKWTTSDNAMKAANYATEIHGGLGFMEEVGVTRRYRDAKGMAILQGGTTLYKWIAAQEILGQSN